MKTAGHNRCTATMPGGRGIGWALFGFIQLVVSPFHSSGSVVKMYMTGINQYSPVAP